MKKWKQWFCGALVCLLLFSSVVGCAGKNGPHDETDSSGEGTTAATDEGNTNFSISVSDLADYAVIRSADAGADVLAAMQSLISAVKSAYSVTLSPKDDYYREDVPSLAIGEHEILIGDVDRDESRTFLQSLKASDWGYGAVNGKLVIAGRTEEGTVKAVEHFIESCMGKENGIFFASSQAYLLRGSYRYEVMKLNEVELGAYSIVYPSANSRNEKMIAEYVQEHLQEVGGYVLPVLRDTEFTSGKAICIGEVDSKLTADLTAEKEQLLASDNNSQYYIGAGNNGVWVAAKYYSGMMAGALALLERFTSQTETSISVSVENGAVTNYTESEKITSMSFNILYNTSQEGSAERMERVVKMIAAYMPDTIGVQEATTTWMNFLKQELGIMYECVGVGRNADLSGECSAVFYRRDKFTLVEEKTLWLSKTPTIAGTKFTDSSLPRIMTYAVLKRNIDGMMFAHVNTHLDHIGAAEKQIEVLVNLLKDLDYPLIVTGDFNVTPTSEVYKTMVSSGYSDSSAIADSAQVSGTFHAYTDKKDHIIDYLFIKNGTLAVRSYKVCNEQIDGGLPSDHYPIYVEYQFYK